MCSDILYNVYLINLLPFVKSLFHSGYSGGGGGSGGSISLSACTIESGSSSLVQANGGAGGRSRYSSTSESNCGGGGGSGGVIQTEMINTVGTLVLQVDGGAPPSAGRKPGVAGSVGKVFLVSLDSVILLMLDFLCRITNPHPTIRLLSDILSIISHQTIRITETLVLHPI